MPTIDDYIEPFLTGLVTIFDLAIIDRIHDLGLEYLLYQVTAEGNEP